MAIKGSGSPMEAVDEYFDMLIKSRFIEMFEDQNYQLIRLGDILKQNTTVTKVDCPDKETFVTLSSKGRGAKKREIKDGKTPVAFSGYRIHAGQFIYSRIDARNAAFDIVPECLEGAVVSKDFPVFDFDTNAIEPVYLLHSVLQNSFIEQIQSSSFGATNRQRIKEETMMNYSIVLPPLSKQREYSQFVQLTIIIKKHYQQLMDSFDILVKSRFIEMFGDPYLSPKYQKMPFMHCLDFNPGKSEVKNVPDDLMVSFVPMDSVGTDGSIDVSKEKTLGEVRKGYTYFRDNDVVFAKITPCFENGKVSIAKKCRNGIGFGTTEFHVARPKEGISNSTWLFYLLRSDSLRMLASGNMSGTAGQKRVQQPFFEKISIGLPPINEQESFASFVKQVDKSKFEVVQSLLRLKSKYIRTETPSKRTDCDL
ncbi:restriction endonuclease subunit S [Methanomethylophilus alvi]|uniref:restriction endonuclease subunit S n=1 Tax=Methanomethylophilus alvi TaxID=1291540 RepID=UPI0037DC7761